MTLSFLKLEVAAMTAVMTIFKISHQVENILNQ